MVGGEGRKGEQVVGLRADWEDGGSGVVAAEVEVGSQIWSEKRKFGREKRGEHFEKLSRRLD